MLNVCRTKYGENYYALFLLACCMAKDRLRSWQCLARTTLHLPDGVVPMSWSTAILCRLRARAACGQSAVKAGCGARSGIVLKWPRIAAACAVALVMVQNLAAQTSDRPPAEGVPVEPVRQVIRGRVMAIADGDTLHLALGSETRVVELAGVDAPEKGQPFGNAAAQVLSLKVLDKEVEVLVLGTAANRATLGIVYREGCVNTALVREGIAWHDERTCPSTALAAAQHEARTAARGLWADKNPIAPAEWRRQNAGLPDTISAVKPPPADGSTERPESEDYSRMFGAETAQKANAPKAAPPPAPAAVGGPRWLTAGSGVRHNSTCRYYGKSQGRPCGENEGRPCKRCGG